MIISHSSFLCPLYFLRHTSQKLSFDHQNDTTKNEITFFESAISIPSADLITSYPEPFLLPRFCLLLFIFLPSDNPSEQELSLCSLPLAPY